MVVPDAGMALLIGIAVGVIGISMWIGGLLVFDQAIKRWGPDDAIPDAKE